MVWKHRGRIESGWSVWEVLLVLFAVSILVLLLLPALAKRTSKASRLSCINNIKQISTGFRLTSNDTVGRSPFAKIGPSNLVGAANLWRLFQYAQNDISSPRILICPQDSKRTAANDFFEETNSQFSSESFAHPSKRNTALS